MSSISSRWSAPVAVSLLFVAACGDADVETSIGPPATTTTSTSTSTVPASTTPAGPSTTATSTTTTEADSVTTMPAPPTTFVPTEGSVTGVVIEVEGTLSGIDWFVLRLEDGTDLTLVPEEGLLFDGVAPISHLRDHLVSGVPVEATYVTSPEGPPVVTSIGDAGGGEHSHDE